MFFPPVAATTECVRVVVDYGTFLDSPPGPNTHCTAVPYGDTAAQALARRATDLHATAPRYASDGFLCGVDGYPETGCGEKAGEPYWSFWIWRNGAWTYSSSGVASYWIEDSDKDGHPDPIGLRYQSPSPKAEPRSNPGYPPPTPHPTTPAPTVAPTATTGTNRGSRSATPTAAPHPSPSATPDRLAPSGPVTPGPTSGAASPGTDPTAAPTAPPGIAPRAARSFPVGAASGGVLAALLLGATVWRFRRTRSP